MPGAESELHEPTAKLVRLRDGEQDEHRVRREGREEDAVDLAVEDAERHEAVGRDRSLCHVVRRAVALVAPSRERFAGLLAERGARLDGSQRRKRQLAVSPGLERLKGVRDRVLLTRVIGGERRPAVRRERIEPAGGDPGAQDAVAVGVVDDDDRLLVCLTRLGWCVGIRGAPVESEVRGRDRARHPNGRGVVVDVEDPLRATSAQRFRGIESTTLIARSKSACDILLSSIHGPITSDVAAARISASPNAARNRCPSDFESRSRSP